MTSYKQSSSDPVVREVFSGLTMTPPIGIEEIVSSFLKEFPQFIPCIDKEPAEIYPDVFYEIQNFIRQSLAAYGEQCRKEERERMRGALKIKDALHWSDKHRSLGDGEGVRTVHIASLIEKILSDSLKQA